MAREGLFALGFLRVFLCVVASGMGAVASAADPVLRLHRPVLTQYAAAATSHQHAQPNVLFRGTGIDGTAVTVPGVPLSIHGALTGDVGAGSRWHKGVHLATGAFTYSGTQLALPAHVPWTIGVSYTSAGFGAGNAGEGYQGWYWFQESRPEIVLSEVTANAKLAGDVLYLVYSAHGFAEFKRADDQSEAFAGVNGASGVWVRSGGTSGQPELYTLHEQTGRTAVFFGFVNTGPAAGQLWKVSDAAGHAAYVGHESSAADAISEGFGSHGFVRRAFDSAGRRFSYVYSTAAIGNVHRLVRVVAEVKKSGSWEGPGDIVEAGRVEYAYYLENGSNGLAGDLKSIAVTTPMTPAETVVRQVTHFRYWVGDQNGPAHAMRMVVEPEGVRRMDAADGPAGAPIDGSAPADAAADSLLEPYSAAMLWYSDGRVAQARYDGLVAYHNFSYEANPAYAAGTSYQTAWRSRAVVMLPGTDLSSPCYLTQYCDEAGQPLSRVLSDGSPELATDHWVTRVVRDAAGCVVAFHTPANCASYEHNNQASAPTGVITSKPNDGLVYEFERVEAGAAGQPVALGFVRSVKERVGAAGDAGQRTIGWSYDHGEITPAGGVALARPVIAATHVYPSGNATPESGILTTSRSHAWWPGTLAVQSIVRTEPAVLESHHGTGESFTTAEYFTADGALTFGRTQGGRINYFAYEPLTGLLTSSVQDADTSILTGVTIPSGFASETGQAWLHRVTAYSYDDQGRPTGEVLPGGRTTARVYSRLADHRVVVVDVPAALPGQTVLYAGPATMTVLNHAGNIEGDGLIQPSQARAGYRDSLFATGTAPAGWISTSATDPLAAVTVNSGHPIVSFSSVLFDPSGTRAVERRVYSDTRLTQPQFDAWQFEHDALGRVVRTVEPCGNIHRVDFDVLGRPVAGLLGTDDSGSPNMLAIWRQEYDGGTAGGNGLPTSRRVYPDGHSTNAVPREWQMHYDGRGRLMGIVGPEAPHMLRQLDNLGRPVGMALYDWATPPSNILELSPATHLNGRRAYWTQEYDALGRVWRDHRYEVDPVSGAAGESIATERWFGPHGNLVLSAGETVEKYQYDRSCALVTTVTLAGTPANQTNAEARAVGPHDIVLQQHHYFPDRQTGVVLAEATVQRNPRANFSLSSPQFVEPGLGMIWTPQRGIDSSGNPTLTIPPSIDGIIWLKMITPNELGIPIREMDPGNLGLPRDSQGLTLCLGMDCGTPIPASDPWREFELEYDPRLWFSGYKATPNGQPWRQTFDDAGRRVKWQMLPRPQELPWEPPAGLPDDPCPQGFGWEMDYRYDKGRLVEREIKLYGLGVHPTERFIYPDHFHDLDGSIPPDFPIAYPRIRRNDFPLVIAPPDFPAPSGNWPLAPIPQSYFAADAPLRWILRNGLGELEAERGPGGVLKQFLDRDKLGRPRRQWTSPGTLTPPAGAWPLLDQGHLLQMELRWDGQPLRVRRWDGLTPGAAPTGLPSADPSSELRWQYDGWGLLQALKQNPGGPLPLTPPSPDPRELRYDVYRERDSLLQPTHPEWTRPGGGSAPVRGWDFPRRRSIQLPGLVESGTPVPLGMAYYPDRANLSPMSEQGIDLLVGRPSAINEEGLPLTRYGYLGIYEPTWRDFPAPALERPIYMPGYWPPPNHETSDPSPVHPPGGGVTRWGQKRLDIWRENIDGPLTPGNENGLFEQPRRDIIWLSYGRDPAAGSSATDPNPWDGLDHRIREVRDHTMTMDRVPDVNNPTGPWLVPPAGFDRRMFYDCRDRLLWCGQGVNPELPGANSGWHSSGSGYDPPPSRNMQVWHFGRSQWGNITRAYQGRTAAPHDAWPSGPSTFPSSPGSGSRRASAYDAGDREITEDPTNGTPSRGIVSGSGAATSFVGSATPRYDVAKNQASGDDGINEAGEHGWHYQFDAAGALRRVYRREAGAALGTGAEAGGVGALYAKLEYNALGQLSQAVYDEHEAAGETDTTRFDNETIERYYYDEHWRLVAIETQGPVDTSASPPARPEPRLYQRYLWHHQGPGGFGNGSNLPDQAVYVETDADGDGKFERRLYLLQNHNGDVLALKEAGSDLVAEQVRYTPYGVPTRYTPLDINRDGVTDAADGAAFTVIHGLGDGYVDETGDRRADLNGDGKVGGDDFDEYFGRFDPGESVDGRGELSSRVPEGEYAAGSGHIDNRIGFGGYVWDPRLRLYHVRHRVYDPRDGRWLQPDPIGYAGGWNLYEYCNGDPVNAVDPWGLCAEPGDRAFRAALAVVSPEAYRLEMDARRAPEPDTSPRQPTEVERWADSYARLAAALAEKTISQLERGLITLEDAERRLRQEVDGSRAAINTVLTDHQRVDEYAANATSLVLSTVGNALLATGAGNLALSLTRAIQERAAVAAAEGAARAAPEAGSTSLTILNPHFTPDAGRVLQNLTTQTNRELAANPALAKTVLSSVERTASQGPRAAPMAYGNAVERMVADKIVQDPLLRQILQHVGGRGKPDFIGVGPAAGRVFDITTPGHWPAHLLRPYGLGLEPALYTRPPGFTGFP